MVMMPPQGMMAADQQPMSDEEARILQAIDDSTIKVSGVTKSATEGDATNFVISAEQFISLDGWSIRSIAN